jgi:transcriptional regulator with XRE-family HTH domain
MRETPEDAGPPGRTRKRASRQNGPAIRALREKDGWSQTGLAKAAGIEQCTLSLIESESTNARVSTLNALARRLRVPVDAIMRDHDETTPLPQSELAGAS